MIVQDNLIRIRKMNPAPEDFHLFLRWMSDPENKKYWDGFSVQWSYELIEEHYRKHLQEQVQSCILEYDGLPIGYLQFYPVLSAEEYEVPPEPYHRFVGQKETVYGIDLFLGEIDYRDRGIGTRCMKLLMQALFDDYHADALLIDPKTHNTRAIRCYQKCGFQELFVVPAREEQDGIAYDSLIMGIKKEDFRFFNEC